MRITYGRGDAQLSMSVSPPSRYMNTKEATIRMNSVTTWIVNITNATLAESCCEKKWRGYDVVSNRKGKTLKGGEKRRREEKRGEERSDVQGREEKRGEERSDVKEREM